ncbi:hypothetical protein AZH53_02895 [Methanomicrobiaceae archaeon CYW5]|uniref:nickel insertion protein n=1 Tax=Methanovulcanius yangii TaxID=1789227 RepID=UPI0029CAA19E|nr:nickel insertion protein [Methanovulcanius yangii]MBT8507378.1 hypothetical protein [Methanovulcanius yangii]
MRTFVIDPSESGISGGALAAAAMALVGSAAHLESIAEAISRSSCGAGWEVRYQPPTPGSTEGFVIIGNGTAGDDSTDDLSEAAGIISSELDLSPRAHEVMEGAIADLSRFDSAAGIGDIIECVVPLALMDRAGILSSPVCSLPPAAGLPSSPVIAICARHRVPLPAGLLHESRTTSAGMALLANMAECIDTFPGMIPCRIVHGGDGTGRVLRIIEGESSDVVEERIVLLETNIDDVTGEVMAYAQQRLLAEGAVDVYFTPVLGKKSRPAHVLTVITNRRLYRHLTGILMEETGTLGVRIYEVPRLVAKRKRNTVPVEIAGGVYDIRVKRSTVDGIPIALKPEFEDMKQVAETTGLPLRTIAAVVMRQLEPFGQEKP